MLKLKVKQSAVYLLTFLIMGFLPILTFVSKPVSAASVLSCVTDKTITCSRLPGSAAKCDQKADRWCVGECNNTETEKVKDPKTGKDIEKQKNPLSEFQMASCECDGTPNLNDEQLISCKACQNQTNQENCFKNNPIVKRVNDVIKVVSGLIAVVITAMIMIGGIEYATSGGVPEKAAAGKKRIVNALIALAAFLLTFTILNWLIPGGL